MINRHNMNRRSINRHNINWHNINWHNINWHYRNKNNINDKLKQYKQTQYEQIQYEQTEYEQIQYEQTEQLSFRWGLETTTPPLSESSRNCQVSQRLRWNCKWKGDRLRMILCFRLSCGWRLRGWLLDRQRAGLHKTQCDQSYFWQDILGNLPPLKTQCNRCFFSSGYLG